MLSRIARGVPRFSITRDRLSLSTRFSSLPKFDLARKAEITILLFAAVLALGTNSPVHPSELYSYKDSLSMGTDFTLNGFTVKRRPELAGGEGAEAGFSPFWAMHSIQPVTRLRQELRPECACGTTWSRHCTIQILT